MRPEDSIPQPMPTRKASRASFLSGRRTEVQAVLPDPEDVRRVCAYYDITDQGNWEHRSIPNRLRPLEVVLKELDITGDELLETMTRVRPLLYQARTQTGSTRVGRQDHHGLEWHDDFRHGRGRARARRRTYVDAAGRAANFLLQVHRSPDGRLLRTSRQGRAHLDGVLEDYAYLGEGLIDLYEAGGETVSR